MKGDVDVSVIRREVRIAAPAKIVFSYLTDPHKYVLWKGHRAELDPRPGGIFRVEFGNGTDVVRGEFVEVVPGRRVVFTWGWEGSAAVPPGASVVEIDLEPSGSGTLLRLVHRGLPLPAVAKHTEGWDRYLPRLARVAGAGDAGADE